MKLRVNNSFKKAESIATIFEHSSVEDFIKKAYLYTNLSTVEGHILYIKKDYNEFTLHDYKKQPVRS